MEHALLVRGACACGRNRYVVEIPSGSVHLADVLLDTSNTTRQHHASPFTPYLRVPLPWYRSYTFAQHPEETPRHIRRVFTSPFSPQHRRQFCGFCGTQLTSWNERSIEDAELISLTLGSVIDEDLVVLEDAGVLPDLDESADEEEKQSVATPRQRNLVRSDNTLSQSLRLRGAPWFQDVIDSSQLGRLRRQKGGHTSDDGRVTVEWEIYEWTDEAEDHDATASLAGKRKIGELGEDTDMRSA